MTDICLNDILKNGEELYNNAEVDDAGDIAYDPKWVRRQRAILRRKLGKHSSGDETLKYSDVDAIIDINDVTVATSRNYRRRKASTAAPTSVEVVAESSSSADTDTSKENWFVRILRHMVSCILHSRWERRHGCCIALVAIIEGMGWIHRASGVGVEVAQSALRLPAFLAEDVLTACVSVLLLDRYMDITGEVSTATSSGEERKIISSNWQSSLYLSPVKEAAAELISVASAAELWSEGVDAETMNAVSDRFFGLVIHTSVEMCRYTPGADARNMWRVNHSGFVLIKHLLRSEKCFERICAVPGSIGTILTVICEAIVKNSNDDIRGSAIEALVMRPVVGDLSTSEVIRPHLPTILRTFKSVLPTISGVLASSLLVVSAQALYCCMKIGVGSALSSVSLCNCIDILSLAADVGSDLLTRFLHMYLLAKGGDIELTRALPVCVKYLLMCCSEIHCEVFPDNISCDDV
jgi:hypothetical protein